MSDTPCRLAVIGLGKIAIDQHLPALTASPAFTLAATVDPARGNEGAVPHFASFEQLLASSLPFDAVSICTPPQHRVPLALAAIAAGRHVLLEKPPATTMAQAEALRTAAAQAGVVLFAAWHSRYAAGVAPARAWLSGKTVRRVAVTWREDVRVWHPGQAWIWREGGFGVFDPGINALSIVTEILPQHLAVTGGALQFPANCAAPVSGQVSLTDEAGVPVSLDLDFLQTGPQTWDIRVATDGGELLLSAGGSVLLTPDGGYRAEDCEYPALYAHFARAIAAGASVFDLEPLRLVGEALARCRMERVAEFHE